MQNRPHPVSEDPAFLPIDPALEALVRARGDSLLGFIEQHPAPGLFSKKGAYARLMEWSMRDPAFKTQLFRFVDVLPALRSAPEVVRHLQEYLGDRAVELHPAVRAGLAAAGFAPGLVAGPVRAQIADLAKQFVAGETPEDLLRQFRRNAAEGRATTIDLLGETVVSDAEADVFLRRNLEVLDTFAREVGSGGAPCESDVGPRGPLPRVNLSVKISALTPDVHPADPDRSIVALKQRLHPILRRAAATGAFVNFDMESYKLKDLTLRLFRSIAEEEEFRSAPMLGIAIQAYLRDAEADLRSLAEWAAAHGRTIGVRLVKGAYWDHETILARQRGWPVPVWERKAESDANFEKLTRFLLERAEVLMPAFATHNVRSCAHAIAQAERLGVDARAFEFQALYGMADDLKAALRQMRYRVREYCAVGALLPGMAYLVRRLLENTSNEGFLRMQHSGEASRVALLTNPTEMLLAGGEPESVSERVGVGAVFSRQASESAIGRLGGAAGERRVGGCEFRNAPNTDFSRIESQVRLRAALVASHAAPVREWPLQIGGRAISDRVFENSTNPARPSEIIGRWARATPADAAAAVEAARAAQPAWARTPVAQRAAMLDRAAELMERRRFEWTALLIREAAKPWIEADGDVSEAIDFCRYYAEQMRRLAKPRRTQAVPGEDCRQVWMPRGVGVAIAPWNFPLAILCGLTVAPLVGGNAMVMKPAKQTSVIGAQFAELLHEAGVPPGALNLLTGHGEEIGDVLCAHPGVDFIAFTGSRGVGCRVWETAGRTAPGQFNLKKVVCEMGGKNALIVDADADLDEAIPAVLYSAFGYSGQKCSALSRLILHDSVHDAFLERFLPACCSVPVGDPSLPGTVVGPVIDAAARSKILAAIEQGRHDSTQAHIGTIGAAELASGGYYVPPAVFTGVKPTHAIAREEIFGPVLAVLRARDLDEAFAIANGVDYALTGALFSRSPQHLSRAREEFLVGNLYLNRGTTGAIVERHPFGGFKMSGGGTKAGGEGYLENFLFPRVIAENTLRRGFAPPEEEV